MAKSRGIRILAVSMTLFLRNNRNNTSSTADVDRVVLGVACFGLSIPACII